jgi:hypothetical protein
LDTKEIAVASRKRTVSHFRFHQGLLFLAKNNMSVVLKPPYFNLLPRLKIELKVYCFNTVEVIMAESQTVLNTLTEHYFRNSFKMTALVKVLMGGTGLLRG